jgi:hypothetical protein
MNLSTRTKIGLGIGGGVLVLALLGGGTALAVSGGSDGSQLSGPTADQARAAAVAAVPGGRADAVRAETDGGAAYGVSVARPDGRTVVVTLDRTYHVLGTQPAGNDGDGTDGDEG